MLGKNTDGDQAAHEAAGGNHQIANPSRRRFTRAGAAAPVVLGSLASQPVLGSTSNYHCTISGKLSGNLSRPDGVTCKTIGKAPDKWKTMSWPCFTKGGLPNNNCQYSPAGTFFNGCNVDGRTLGNAFRIKKVNGVCKVIDSSEAAFANASVNASLYTILETGGQYNASPLAAFGRATVASLLNARQYGAPNGLYPLTQAQIIDMFNAVYSGGTYQLPASTEHWNLAQVQAYFESLYGAI